MAQTSHDNTLLQENTLRRRPLIRILYRDREGQVHLEPFRGKIAALVRLVALKERGATILSPGKAKVKSKSRTQKRLRTGTPGGKLAPIK